MGFALTWLAAFSLYLATLCPTIAAGDSAELLLAGLSLDVTHPPGYPLLAMLLRLALEVPAGSLAFRAGLACAAAGALATALVFSAALRFGTSRAAAALAAALFAVSPLAWWQSTMLEKYALQLALAALVLRACLPAGGSLLTASFAWGLALAHHSIAIFLLPVLAYAAWRDRARWNARGFALAALLALLPLAVRPMYTAIRSDALHRAEAAGSPARSINWCEPYRAQALADYLRVRYYAARFGPGVNLERASLRDHLGYFPRELTWPGLLLAVAGLVILLRRLPAAGAAVLGAMAVSAAFNSRFVLPPSLAVVYHQDAFLLLALCSAPAMDAVLRAAGRASVRAVVVVIAASALGSWIAGRAAVGDASRHLIVHDYNRGQLALAPRDAVFVASFDYDMFALRYFQEGLGIRPDLVPLQAPVRVGPGQFVVRRRYRPWAAALLPGAVLRFGEDDSGFTILRRMVSDNPGLCFAVSGISEPMAADDVFRPLGNLFPARTPSCGAATPGGRPLRATSGRGWLSPASRFPIHRPLLETWAQSLGRASASARLPGERKRLLLERARIIPWQGGAWSALAACHAHEGRPAEAVATWQRGLEAEPDSVEIRLDLLSFQLRIGAGDAASALLRDYLARPQFGGSQAASRSLARLDAGDLTGAVREADRAFAEAALRQGDALPGNPESDGARQRFYRMAVALAPDWPEARRVLILALHSRSRFDEAGPHVYRLMALDPAESGLPVAQGAGWLDLRRVVAARDILRRTARSHPGEASAWFYLGQAELGTGDAEGSRRAFERFLALAPSSPMAPSVRGILSGLRPAGPSPAPREPSTR